MTTEQPLPEGVHQPRERAVPCSCCGRPTWHWSALCDQHGGGQLADRLSVLLGYGRGFVLEDGQQHDELVATLIATGVAHVRRDGSTLHLELVTWP